MAIASVCDLKCVLENCWKRLAVSFLNLMPINESIIRRFVANPSLKVGVHRAFVANCRGSGILYFFKLLNISYLKIKRSAKHRIACYPLATPFRLAQRDKIPYNLAKKPIAISRKIIFRYVIFSMGTVIGESQKMDNPT